MVPFFSDSNYASETLVVNHGITKFPFSGTVTSFSPPPPPPKKKKKKKKKDSSKLKEFADDNFELDENGRKFSKWVENTVGKREIAHYEPFFLFPQCFQKTFTADS